MNATYGITSKFQVTIPKKIRDELDITAKDRIEFEHRGNEVVIKKVPTLEDVRKMLRDDLRRRGFNKKVSQADMDRARGTFITEGMKWE
jgi:AbrB family looped-hinge helix DNA binding protein